MRQRRQLNTNPALQNSGQLARRRRRPLRDDLPAADDAPAPSADRSAENAQPPDNRTGPKLRPAQQKLLLKMLALYVDFRTVREALREVDPDFPDVDDRTLYRYRSKKDKRTLQLMEEALDEALTASVADKRRRIAELSQLYRRLTRRSWELDRMIDLPRRDWRALQNPAMPPALRELREVDSQRGAVLRQLMQETDTQSGGLPPGATLPGDGADPDDDDLLISDDDYFAEWLAEYLNEKAASDAAMQSAERMQKLMDAVEL